MSRPAFARLPVGVDLPRLLRALERIGANAWQAHFNAGFYTGDWSGVALISAADAPSELAPGPGQPVQRQPWRQDPDWRQALQQLPLRIVSARLLKLGPGAHIHEHRDYDLGGPDADLRLHIPLLSPPEVDFLLDGQRIPMMAGECWFLDLSRPHRVDNHDRQARIHLVLDCRPEPWLERAIAEGLASTPAPGVGRAALAFARFCRLLEEDATLCRALQEPTDSECFIERTLALAAERGLGFTREDLRAAMRQGRQRWNEQWTA